MSNHRPKYGRGEAAAGRSDGADVMLMVEAPQSGCASSARRALVTIALLAGVLAAAPVAAGARSRAGAASATSSIKLFPLPYTLIPRGGGSVRLSDTRVKMVVGPDGALWFSDVHYRADASVAHEIGRISTSGLVSVFALPSDTLSIDALAASNDGALWFTTNNYCESIACINAPPEELERITTSGSISQVPGVIPKANGGLAAGPDGNEWIADEPPASSDSSCAVSDADPSGEIQQFDLPANCSQIGAMTAGPDGALWFAGSDANFNPMIGTMTLAGAFTGYDLPDPNMAVTGIASGSDGALWFTENSSNDPSSAGRIGRISTQGHITEFELPRDRSGAVLSPGSITSGPDGALWFTAGMASPSNAPVGDIGRITTAGKVSLYSLPGSEGGGAIVAGPDGNLWIAFIGAVGRLAPTAHPGMLSVGAPPRSRHRHRHPKRPTHHHKRRHAIRASTGSEYRHSDQATCLPEAPSGGLRALRDPEPSTLPKAARRSLVPRSTHRCTARSHDRLNCCALAAIGAAPAFAVLPSLDARPRTAGPARAASRGLASLPFAAHGPVSRALGRDDRSYWATRAAAGSFRLINSGQRLRVTLGSGGVLVRSGGASFALGLSGYGYGRSLWAVAAAAPRANANRVVYRRGALSEWYANGPLGLEQGFDLARRPAAGVGALTFSLALSARARLEHGAVMLPGGLRYGGVRARDARGRALRAWLELRGGRVLVRVDDHGARYPVQVDPFIQQAELTASDGAAGDKLGWSVAVSANTIVAGAPAVCECDTANKGAAYVFTMSAGGWADTTQTAKLTASDGAASDELGYSVAVSGNTIVAEAPFHVGSNGSRGAAYAFVMPAGGWVNATQTAELTASDGTRSDELGYSVAVSGNTIVAGAPSAAYVFVMPAGGWVNATQTAELTAADGAPNDNLGTSVAVSGNTIVAGASSHQVGANRSQGAAYVFMMPAGGWVNATQTAELTAADGAAGDELGRSVAVSGSTIVAGAPGHQVAANVNQGAAYVFEMPAGGWVDARQTAEPTAGDGAAGDSFGLSVAVSGDAVVSGASLHQVGANVNQGATYVFVRPAAGQSLLSVAKAGSGTGTVSSSPAGIDCGQTCSQILNDGTQVTLTATAAAGSVFAGLSGGGCSGTVACTITLNSDTTVSATFTARWTLTVATSGSGAGSVTSSPAGIDCGQTCSDIFDQGMQVTLTATAAIGSILSGWSGGGCSGTGSCVVTLGADTAVTATFEPGPSSGGGPPPGCQSQPPVRFGVIEALGCLQPVTDPSQIPGPEKQALCTKLQLKSGPCDDRLGTAIENADTDPLIAHAIVRVNGLDVTPDSGAVVLFDPQAKLVLSSHATVQILGDKVSLYSGALELDGASGGDVPALDANLDQLKARNDVAADALNLGGFELTGTLSVTLAQYTTTLGAAVQLPTVFSAIGVGGPVSAEATGTADNHDDVQFNELYFQGPSVSFAGDFKLQGVAFCYEDHVSDNFCQQKTGVDFGSADPVVSSWNATATVEVELLKINATPPPPTYGIGFVNGNFAFGGAAATFPAPGFQLSAGVNLTTIGGSFALQPTRITGQIGLIVAGVASINGSVFVVVPQNGKQYTFTGTELGNLIAPPLALPRVSVDNFAIAAAGSVGLIIPFLGTVPLADGYVLYAYPGYVAAGGQINLNLFNGAIMLDGGIQGAANFARGLFDVEGYLGIAVSVGPINASLQASAVVSNVGIGACGQVSFFGANVAASVGDRWADGLGGINVSVGSCDLTPYQVIVPASSARAALADYRLNVAGGLPNEMVKLIGRGGPPDVTITGPGGIRASTGGASHTEQKPFVIKRDSRLGTTYIAIINPPAGDYAIRTNPGSPAIARVLQAHGFTPDVKARVTGTGSRRRLVYAIKAEPGQNVAFIERGEGVDRLIGSTRRSHGALQFTPAPGPGGIRQILATVTENGYPVVLRPSASSSATGGSPGQLTVARYSAPGPRRLGRVRRLRASRAGNHVLVFFDRVPAAKQYVVVIDLRDGLRTDYLVNRGSLRISVPTVGPLGGRVTVLALGDGLTTTNGPGAIAKIQVPTPHRKPPRRHKPPRRDGHH